MLKRFKSLGLVKVRGKQRTDSTHIVAAVRMLNRLERVGETLRYTLNVLAELAPVWLKAQVPVEWFDRYNNRFENHRLPTEKLEREVLTKTIGADGYALLAAVYDAGAPVGLRDLEAVQLLRTMWIQQFYVENDTIQWRGKNNLPLSETMIASPYDTEARYSHKRSTTWTGYKVHLTETCDDDRPCLITHVETTSATLQDVEVVERVHDDLAEHDNLPDKHLMDMAYMSSDVLVSSQKLDVDLVGPVRPDTSWQAQTEGAFDITCFEIDWDKKRVMCPMGNFTSYWREGRGKHDKPNINAGFKPSDCRACSSASRCTRNTGNGARTLTFPPQAQYLALRTARERQQTDEFKAQYRVRAGVEGVISQAAFTLGMRRTRYRGKDKTHLQNVATASAINLFRAVNWPTGEPKAETRLSSFVTLAA